MPNKSVFSNRLRKEVQRKKAMGNFNQQDLAFHLGLTKSAVGYWLSGEGRDEQTQEQRKEK